MNRLKFSFNSRWASLAMVSNTIDDFPEPETPVKIVILRLGMRSETFFKLFSRAPRISMYSWGMNSLLIRFTATRRVPKVVYGGRMLSSRREHRLKGFK